MRDTYLSIDLDYWERDRSPRKANTFLGHVMSKRVTKVLVHSHEELLRYIPRACKRLINIDTHSDFGNFDRTPDFSDLNDGTWVDFVSGLKEFIWRYPDYKHCFVEGAGRCEGETTVGSDECWDDRESFRGHRVLHAEGLQRINLRRVFAVGIAISPDYWWSGEDVMIKILAKLLTHRFTTISPNAREYLESEGYID